MIFISQVERSTKLYNYGVWLTLIATRLSALHGSLLQSLTHAFRSTLKNILKKELFITKQFLFGFLTVIS